jgi:hypothetical protein
VKGVPQVSFHGGLGDEQLLGDLPVRPPLRGQPGDLALRPRQRIRASQRGAAGPGAGREQFRADVLAQLPRTAAFGEVQGLAQRFPRRAAAARAAPVRAQEGQGVAEAAVVGIPDPFWHEAVAAAIRLSAPLPAAPLSSWAVDLRIPQQVRRSWALDDLD